MLLFSKMLDYAENERHYARAFGDAITNFVEACKLVVSDQSVPKLARLVKNLFQGSNLTARLDDQPASPIEESQGSATEVPAS